MYSPLQFTPNQYNLLLLYRFYSTNIYEVYSTPIVFMHIDICNIKYRYHIAYRIIMHLYDFRDFPEIPSSWIDRFLYETYTV